MGNNFNPQSQSGMGFSGLPTPLVIGWAHTELTIVVHTMPLTSIIAPSHVAEPHLLDADHEGPRNYLACQSLVCYWT